jgi:type III secretion system low calcium response chaperone LcrH/SycD
MNEELTAEILDSTPFNPVIAEQVYALAFSLYQSGDYQKAETAFRLLCARQPLKPKYWIGLGATLQQDQNYPEAMNAWAMASLIEPEDPYPHFHAAECAISIENLNEARLALMEAEKRITAEHPLMERIPLLKKMWKL